jgi:Tfp pilus assembly protein PilO
MALVAGSTFFATEWNSLQTRQVVLAGLMLILASLLFYNFMLAPELKLKKQLSSKILQINSDLKKVKSIGIKFKQENSFPSLQDREKALVQLLPDKWKLTKLLRWQTNVIQQNGLQLEEQNFGENIVQSLIQTLTINLKLSGKYTNFQQFMQQLK